MGNSILPLQLRDGSIHMLIGKHRACAFLQAQRIDSGCSALVCGIPKQKVYEKAQQKNTAAHQGSYEKWRFFYQNVINKRCDEYCSARQKCGGKQRLQQAFTYQLFLESGKKFVQIHKGFPFACYLCQ